MLNDGQLPCRSASGFIPDADTVWWRYRHEILNAPNSANLPQEKHDHLPNYDGIWEDLDLTAEACDASWHALKHLQRLHAAACARVALDGQLDAAAVPVISRSIDNWLLARPRTSNWWLAQIATPKLLGDVLILLGSEGARIYRSSEVGEIFRRVCYRSTGHATEETLTGANLLWVVRNHLIKSALAGDPLLLDDAFRRAQLECRAHPGREGIQSDGSFHQHGPLLYSGGYGVSFLIEVLMLVRLAWGTRWHFPAESMDVLLDFAVHGIGRAVRAGRWDYSVLGRAIAIPANLACKSRALSYEIGCLLDLDVPRRKELEWLHSVLSGGKAQKPHVASARYFDQSDFLAHTRSSFHFSARACSPRTVASESINNEGRRSHFLGHGATCLMRHGGEYLDIFPVWDWWRIPGTTVLKSADQSTPPGEVYAYGTGNRVCGLDDGDSGGMALDLDDGGLRALKSWLCVGDAVYCSGSGIKAELPGEVVTTLDQRWATKEAADGIVVGVGGGFQHDGVLYRTHLGRPEAKVHNRQADWSDISSHPWSLVQGRVLEITISHGERPSGERYAYSLQPAGLEVTHPDIWIVDEDKHVLYFAGSGTLFAVVWHGTSLHLPGLVHCQATDPFLLLGKCMPETGNKLLARPLAAAGSGFRMKFLEPALSLS